MFDMNGSRCVGFIEGLNKSMGVFNKKMHPLKVTGVTLIVNNRKDDYDFSPYVSLEGETILLAENAKCDLEDMKGIQSFYMDLSLNDCTYIRVVVEGCLGSKYKMRLISSDNTYRFIHKDFVKKVWAGQKWSMDFSSTLTAYTCEAEDFHKLLHPDYCAVLMMPEERGYNPESFFKRESQFPKHTEKALSALQLLVNSLKEKGCTFDKLVYTFLMDHYSEEGATELKLDVDDISKYTQEIINIAAEKQWVKINIALPIVFKTGNDIVRICIYEEKSDVCIDYWSEKDTEMFKVVGTKDNLFGKPTEGGSYENDISLIASIIHPDWLRKESNLESSLMDIIKGI